MVHGRRCPGCAYGVAAATSVAGHRGNRMCLGSSGRATYRRRTVMAGGAVGRSCHTSGYVIKRGRQPGCRGMARRALRSGGDVVRFCRCPDSGGCTDRVAALASSSPGMVHGRRCPHRTDRMAAATGVVGHRRRGMCFGTRRCTGRWRVRSVVASGIAIGRARHVIMGSGGRQPGGCSMARCACCTESGMECSLRSRPRWRPRIAGTMAARAIGEAGMVHRWHHCPGRTYRMAAAASGGVTHRCNRMRRNRTARLRRSLVVHIMASTLCATRRRRHALMAKNPG
jgi:hypothetical protein